MNNNQPVKLTKIFQDINEKLIGVVKLNLQESQKQRG